MRGWRGWTAPVLALAACGGTGSTDSIDFGATDGWSGGAPADETTGDAESGDESGGTEGGGTGGDSDVPTLVPLSIDAVESDGPCTPVADGERVVAVGPNAETWLAREIGTGTQVRAFGIDGERTFGFTTEAPLLAATALDGDAGAFATSAGLFTVRGPRIDLLAWPNDPAEIIGLCGDLSVDGDGRVLADDVFTRDLDQWWRWNAPEQLVGPAATMGMASGACADQSGAGYMLHGGTVWSVRSDFVETLPDYGPASALVGLDAFGLASIVDGQLLVGAPEEEPEVFVFEAGPATGLAAADDALYVLAGSRVYRMQDGSFVELRVADAAVGAQSLHGAGAGGVIVDVEGAACFRGPLQPIEILGVRPSAHRRVSAVEVTIHTDGAGLEAALDGASIALSTGDGGEMAFGAEDLEEGWHTLEVWHEGAARVVDFSVERLTPATYAGDIAPLFDEHCSGAGCHGPDPSSEDRPDLSSYGAWVELAESVRNRVGVSADMPPPGATDWGVEDTLLVLGWLDAGLPEGE